MSLNRTVLREQIKDYLLAHILDGAFKPGDRLVETQIAQELGTSQAPVREALRDLESLRFVESQPFKGTRVRAISRDELAEIYPVRAALEELAGQLAAVQLRGNVDALRQEFEAMRAATREHELHDQIHHDVEFHRLIVEASGNGTLVQVWGSLRIEARTLITALKAEIDLAKMVEMHAPIIEALADQDPERSGKALRHHLESFAALLMKGKDV